MTILALDTCFGACSVAVWSTARQRMLSEQFELMERGHSERIVPMIEQTLVAAGVSMAEVNKLAVTVGPGSFTGVRTGIAVARGLALARGIPVCGTSSLHVMAACVRATVAELPIAIAVATRDGLVYFATFEGCEVETAIPPRLASPVAAGASLGVRKHVIAGSGQPLVSGAAPQAGHIGFAGIAAPRAADLARMAGVLPVLVPPTPLYLREADAKPQALSPLASH